jgi:hypothetical protein
MLFYADGFIVYFLEGHSDVLCRSTVRQMLNNAFNLFVRLHIKRKEVEIFLSEEFLYGVVVHQAFSCYLSFSCSVPEELPAHDTF